MEDNKNDLWQGGPWEHPAAPFPPPPAVTIPQRERPVLRPRKRRRRWPWVVLVISLILALCLAPLVIDRLGELPFNPLPVPPEDRQPAQTETYSTEPPDIPQAKTGTGVTLDLQPITGTPLTYTQIYERNAPCLVSIEATGDHEYSTGTGIILTADGYIVTNAHVVADTDLVQVVLWDNTVLDAMLVGFDAREDLAVLKVEAHGLTPARFGDSSDLKCGDPVAAIGDSLGYRSTITDGIISALDREVTVDDVTMVLIQTSAAINFGNSGGALIDQYGQVVGITTIKIISDDGSAEALGFAIPSRRVKYVVDTLIDGRAVRTGVFGFSVSTKPAAGGGLELVEVNPNSDAHAKGLQVGDIIRSANGIPVTCTQDLARIKLDLGPGDTVTLTYLREGVSHTVDVALVDSELIN